jgi:hypothetical protein
VASAAGFEMKFWDAVKVEANTATKSLIESGQYGCLSGPGASGAGTCSLQIQFEGFTTDNILTTFAGPAVTTHVLIVSGSGSQQSPSVSV